MKYIKLIAMSYSLKDIKQELRGNNARQFIHHCMKLILCQETNLNINHWQKELFNFCSWIQQTTIKPSNKWINKHLIDEYFFGTCCDSTDTFSCGLDDVWEDMYDIERNKQFDSQLFYLYRRFCDEISTLLSKHRLTRNEIVTLSNQYLVNKYHQLYKINH